MPPLKFAYAVRCLLLVPTLLTAGYLLGNHIPLSHLFYNLLAYALAREYNPTLLVLSGLTGLSLLLLIAWAYNQPRRREKEPSPDIVARSDGHRIRAENQERIAYLEELLRDTAPPPEKKAPASKARLDEGLDMGAAG